MQKQWWLNSTTIRAALLGFIPAAYGIAKAFGLDIPDGAFESIVEGVAALLNVISLAYVFIGRFKATTALTTDSAEVTVPPAAN